MTGRIITCDHVAYDLPVLLEWDVLYTGTVPCDSFSVTCLYSADMAEVLHRAVSFLCRDSGGNVILHGIVDEYTIRQSEAGRTVSIRGRGYAARLLDNESRPMVYQGATLSEILRNHVTPYGITCAQCAALGTLAGYTVASGESQWRALDDFCRTYGNFSPRFSRTGELLAVPEGSGGRELAIDDGVRVLSLTKRENHYGVLSEVLVIDKTRNLSYSVKNSDFVSRGGQRRRVVYTPGQSTWAAMRYTGEYQIAQSKAGEVELEVALPGLERADPGDTAAVSLTELGLSGVYRVYSAEYACSSEGETTTLVLKNRS